MKKQRQISAFVSEGTNQRLDMFVRETGITKARAIEDAIRAHLDAHDELPESATVPTRIVLTRESWDRFVEMLESDAEPAPALVELMRKYEASHDRPPTAAE